MPGGDATCPAKTREGVMMNRIILKFDNIDHVHSIYTAVNAWHKHRPPAKSLKISYQLEGKQMVVYDKGVSDAIVLTCDDV